jgi:hypothetical protein
MDLQEGLGKLFDGGRVGEVQLVARVEAARLSASMVATCMGLASVIPHGFEVGILQRQTLEVGLFSIEAAIILVSPLRGGHGRAQEDIESAQAERMLLIICTGLAHRTRMGWVVCTASYGS